jgi:hypothetical protein
MSNRLIPLVLFVALGASGIANALTITRPSAGEVIAAGDDYATQVLGNAWDMSDAIDIDTEAEESPGIVNPTFSSGVFSASTGGNGAFFYPLFQGYPLSVNSSRGANFPIDTTHYRYVTIKIRATVALPSAAHDFWRPVFLKDGDSYNQGTYGYAAYYTLTPNTWQILTLDMISQIGGTSPHLWTDYPQVTGLRIEPATQDSGTFASVQVDIDWIRLTAPATSAQKYLVQWTDSGYAGAYNIAAIDAGGTSYPLGSSTAAAISYLADMTFLAPGQYTIKVTRSNSSATASSATFRINSPPQITLTAPSIRGEHAQNFAQVVAGNPWGPIDGTDFSLITNFVNASISYTNPSGSFYGRPANNDPNLFLNLHGQTIDTSVYRSLCFTMKDFGQRSVGLGSVARLFWGNSTGALTTSQDIPLYTGLNEYCFPDLAAIPLVDSIGGTWSGAKAVLRQDPHEFPVSSACTSTPSPYNCHDVQLNSVVLSPFAQANPGYTFTWTFVDTDDAADTVDVYLDPDTTPGNGNEMLIGSTVPASGGQYVWPGSNSVNYGTYHALIVATDGKNVVDQYAGGVIIVGARDGIFRNGFEMLP